VQAACEVLLVSSVAGPLLDALCLLACRTLLPPGLPQHPGS
jgi:hypothetical protein